MTFDRSRAELLVVESIAALCRDYAGGYSDEALRRELAGGVYLRWRKSAPSRLSTSLDSAAVPMMTRLRQVSEEQRLCLVLCMFGAQSYTQVAGLIGLPADRVAMLLRTGLLDLAGIDPSAPGFAVHKSATGSADGGPVSTSSGETGHP